MRLFFTLPLLFLLSSAAPTRPIIKDTAFEKQLMNIGIYVAYFFAVCSALCVFSCCFYNKSCDCDVISLGRPRIPSAGSRLLRGGIDTPRPSFHNLNDSD